MLDIFKSGLVKRTVRNWAIHLDSCGESGVKSGVKYWVGRQSLEAHGFLLLVDKRRVGQVQSSGALGQNALVIVVTK